MMWVIVGLLALNTLAALLTALKVNALGDAVRAVHASSVIAREAAVSAEVAAMFAKTAADAVLRRVPHRASQPSLHDAE